MILIKHMPAINSKKANGNGNGKPKRKRVLWNFPFQLHCYR